MLDQLIRLYPGRWRERYGEELAQLVHDLRPSRPAPRLAADLVRGALHAHLEEGLTMENRRLARQTALIVGIVWLGLSLEILRSNVVFPSTQDDDAVSVLVAYLCVFVALALVGAVAARSGADRRAQAIAGLAAGVAIGALTIATFAVVDNVWLGIVSQQQAKIDGLAHSGGGSMRAYVNQGLVLAMFGLSAMLGLFGVALSLAGGIAGQAWRTRANA
ncbi:hypothetical protein [Paractinoplanes globisporus]|uniref:Uncharacterized protein n=1 Tax=Paractinoplanes globisporus TaxID=113565 RepID=A0ABW6WVG4_9ACTN|nr:hypothetical protein [Actinoplanes globisporus]